MPTNERTDAVVIGAGLAGSSLAKRLAEKGWHTVLIDSKTFPRHKVCGEFLSPESLLMLNTLGLRESVAQLNPANIERARLIFNRGAMIEFALPGTAWGVSRHKLDAVLLESAVKSGAELKCGMTVTSVRRDEEDYVIETVQHGHKAELRARTVFAAWGSRVRSGILPTAQAPESLPSSNKPRSPEPLQFLPSSNFSQTSQSPHSPTQSPPRYRTHREAKTVSFVGVKSHYSSVHSEPVVELYFFKGGYVGISPIEQGMVNVAALLTMETARKAGTTVQSILEAAGREHPQLGDRLAGASPIAGTQVSVAPIGLMHRPAAWQTIPHLGDAAAMIPPLCGDGMSMALRSSLLCAAPAERYLQGELSLSGWEREYTEAIGREFKSVMKWGRLLHDLSFSPALTRIMSVAAKLFPTLPSYFVRATRLREPGL